MLVTCYILDATMTHDKGAYIILYHISKYFDMLLLSLDRLCARKYRPTEKENIR